MTPLMTPLSMIGPLYREEVVQMSKRLSQDQLAELTNLRNRSNLILDFLAEKIGNVPVISKFKQLVAREFETKRLRGLRIVSKDISSWGKQLSPADLLELEHRLQSQLGLILRKTKQPR